MWLQNCNKLQIFSIPIRPITDTESIKEDFLYQLLTITTIKCLIFFFPTFVLHLICLYNDHFEFSLFPSPVSSPSPFVSFMFSFRSPPFVHVFIFLPLFILFHSCTPFVFIAFIFALLFSFLPILTFTRVFGHCHCRCALSSSLCVVHDGV